MKLFLVFILLIVIISCDQPLANQREVLPTIDQKRFDTLHDWDLGWALVEPISSAVDLNLDPFSTGQQALSAFWNLNTEVTNGGFIQFYWNGYEKEIPALKDGLKLTGDSALLSLVNKADSLYQANKKHFSDQKKKDDWSPLYENLTEFDTLDSIYYRIHQTSMELFEEFIRKNPKQFAKVI